jgi:hypothetical protein
MSESPDAGRPAYGVLRLSTTDGNTSHNLEEVRRTALEAAQASGQVIAVFQVLGYAVPADVPASWLPAEGSGDAPKTEAAPAAVSPSPPPPQQTPLPPPPPARPVPPPVDEQLPWADEESRRRPKHASVRGVELPKYVDITATAGASGPPTPETMKAAEEESTRIGGKLGGTVQSWTGLPLNEVNQATMEKVVEILRDWKK